MPLIHFITHDGHTHGVEVPLGQSVMQGAVDNNVPGIDAECGGDCACGTCQVYIDPAWLDRIGLPPAASDEASLLSFADNSQPGSRLSCQIPVTDGLDGLVIRVPEKRR